jgi:L-ribulose-5-phosphate 3-epimerase UlaE
MKKNNKKLHKWDKELREELKKSEEREVVIHFQSGSLIKGKLKIQKRKIFINGTLLEDKPIGFYRFLS